MTDQSRVGFIGLGLMGLPMARNVLRAGIPLTVFNRTRAKADQLGNEGAKVAGSIAELTSTCDVVLSCVRGPHDVEDVYLGHDGVIGATRSGMLLCDMSTVDPATHRKVAAAAAERGTEYLDAPVSGGTSGARDATLAIMVGGSAEAFARAKPIFEAMGKHIYHVGPAGAGATVKLINQLMGAICNLGVAEGLVIGKKAGIDPAVLVDIIMNSSGASRTLTGAGPAILRGDFEPGFTIDLNHKDVALAGQMARELGVRALATTLAEQIFQEARGAGFGDRANHSIIRPLEQLSGVEVRAAKE